MYNKFIYLIIILLLSTIQLSAQYLGGVGDGYGNIPICGSTLDGVTSPLQINPIAGADVYCQKGIASYSVSELSSVASSFTWTTSVPGAMIIGGQGTNTVTIFFATADPVTLSVVAQNICGDVSNMVEKEINSIVCTMFTGGINDGFAMITSKPAISLPVTWLSVLAELSNNMVKVVWQTSSEMDNDYFEVERSTNLVDFTTVARVDGQGDTDIVQSYHAYDYEPIYGVAYYRIKQVDFNGEYTYSDLVRVDYQIENNDCHLYPNPYVSDKLYANIPITYQGQTIHIKLLDVTGKIVTSSDVPFSKVIDLTSLVERKPQGPYIVQIEAGSNTSTHLLIKEF